MKEKMYQLMKEKPVQIATFLFLNYRALGMEHEEFIVFMHIDNGEQNIKKIAQAMGITETELFNILQNLLSKQLVMTEQKILPDGKKDVYYSFYPLYQKAIVLLQQKEPLEQTEDTLSVADLIKMFEQEFGRSLTPLEFEMIESWIREDHYSMDLIKLALKEAVLSQVWNLKYIDRILLSWEKKNIKTEQDVEKQGRQYREQKISEETVSRDDLSVLGYDWLKNG